MQKFIFASIAIAVIACHPRPKTAQIVLENPKKSYWFLSERYPYQFMRIELHEKHTEGLPSLTLELKILTDSVGSTWRENGAATEIAFIRPQKGTIVLTPQKDTKAYVGRYKIDKIKLPVIDVRIGKEHKALLYTTDEAEVDRVLRENDKLKLDVVWGPTPTSVSDIMFAFTKPTANDTIYDLGCGDARILIRAAEKFGSRGIGYDLDQKLLDKGMAEAKKRKVDHLVTLSNQNLFTANISDATIVALYLGERNNNKLKPKLFRDLKPGTKIVSHNWHMTDWQVDNSQLTKDKTRIVYFWIMPANLSGVWQSADSTTRLTIHQQYQMVDATIFSNGGEKKFEGLRIVGTKLTIPQLDTLEFIDGKLVGKTEKFIRKEGTQEPFAM
ncbi:MAG: hypothetical protein LDLANPLL_01027 [Turneriella sp.]|nr:hypothetical protein [Turneriella sp.]